jgi:hypothetical protein
MPVPFDTNSYVAVGADGRCRMIAPGAGSTLPAPAVPGPIAGGSATVTGELSMRTATVQNTAWLVQAIEDIQQPTVGYVYLLHLSKPIGAAQTSEQRRQYGLPARKKEFVATARHYIGWCSNMAVRVQDHATGRSKASRFMAAAKTSGASFEVVRAWHGDKALERWLKNKRNAPKLCPICAGRPVQMLLFELTPAEIADTLIPF